MRIKLIQAALILGLVSLSRADAGPILYATTDLGSAIQYKTDPDGQTYGVDALNRGVVYAFDKSPVTPISIDVVPNNPFDFYSGGYERLTLQSGSYQAGYIYNNVNLIGYTYYPTFELPGNGWYYDYGSPISDVNIHGQVVGLSQTPTGLYGYAAFSNINEQSHGYDAALVDNLNNYIAPIPGVTLTEAYRIDDFGRIITQGSDGDVYLLTPVSLGAPAIVPEPTTLTISGLVISCLGVRVLSRRSRPC